LIEQAARGNSMMPRRLKLPSGPGMDDRSGAESRCGAEIMPRQGASLFSVSQMRRKRCFSLRFLHVAIASRINLQSRLLAIIGSEFKHGVCIATSTTQARLESTVRGSFPCRLRPAKCPSRSRKTMGKFFNPIASEENDC
jgi:hypothetical protein